MMKPKFLCFVTPFRSLILVLVVSSVKAFYNYGDFGSIVVKNLNTSKQVGTYDYAAANFGPNLKKDNYYKGILHKAHPDDGCGPIDSPPYDIKIPSDEGWFALIRRSRDNERRQCNFIEKVLNAQKSGYVGVIIYDYDEGENYIHMNADNTTQKNMVNIPSVFVTYYDGVEMALDSYPDENPFMSSAEIRPYDYNSFSPYKILIPMAFSFVGVLLVAIIVMFVRWCQTINKRRKARISKSQLKKIPLVKYKKDDQYDCCAICLDDYEEGEKVRLLPCSHIYHQKCIDPWLLKNKCTCPVCKRRVIPKPPRRNRRESDSSESEDSEAGEGEGNRDTERTPLLPPPAGRTTASEERLGAVGGVGRYGSSGMADRVSAPPPDSDDNSDEELVTYSSRSNARRSPRRSVNSRRRGADRRASSSSEDVSDSEHDLRRNLIVHVSMTPQSYVDAAHSLRSIPSRSRLTQSADDSYLIPPLQQEPPSGEGNSVDVASNDCNTQSHDCDTESHDSVSVQMEDSLQISDDQAPLLVNKDGDQNNIV